MGSLLLGGQDFTFCLKVIRLLAFFNSLGNSTQSRVPTVFMGSNPYLVVLFLLKS